MKAVITTLSVLAKYKRWDAGFFTGMLGCETAQEKVRKAQQRVNSAQLSLLLAKHQLAETQERVAGMVERGEILPLDGQHGD